MSEYEEVLKEIGSFGPYQVRVFILVSLFETPLAWAMLLPIFAGASPKWSCHPNMIELTAGNFSTVATVSKPIETNYTAPSDVNNSCSVPSSECDVYFHDEFTSIVSEWNLICDRKFIPSLITSIQMGGVLFGALATGQLADIFGRRKLLFIEFAVLSLIMFCSAFSTSWEMYATFRFFIGALVGGTLVVNFVLPLEFVGPRWRTFCGCIGFWAIGLMTLALWAFFIRDWRHLTMAVAVSGLPVLLTWWFIPESPRWLLNRGRNGEAVAIIKKMAEFNKKPIPDCSNLDDYSQREQDLKEHRRQYSFWHLFSSAALAKSTLIVMYGWFVSSAVYYGMNFNLKNLAGNRYLNVFVSGLVEIPALIFVVVVNNRLGRRKTTFILFLVAGVFSFSILFLNLTGKITEWVTVTVIFAMLGKSGIAGGWAAMQVFSAEVFPTVVRNIGIGSCSMASRIGGIIAPQLVELGEIANFVPFTVFGCLALVCSVLCLMMKETVGRPLPDQLPRHSFVKIEIKDETDAEHDMNLTDQINELSTENGSSSINT